ncbi:MAG: cytochrome c oxidase assembly protein [Deltaproteobacteria bacterium]
MNILEFLTSTWTFEPWVLITAFLLLITYGAASGFRFTRKTALLTAGTALMVIAVVSPLDYLGRNYLFSAHMIQHILLLLIVPLLLLLGLPESAARKALAVKPLGSIMGILGNPVIAWSLGVGSMWVWHMPSLHDAVLRNETLYIAQQISFVFIGAIFWWPVFAPVKERRLEPLRSTLYLASACLGCTVLGILITFAGAGLYAAYLSPVDSAGILPYLRNDLCLTPGVDQQIGGLTMWVPGCLIYLTASMITIAEWYGSADSGGLTSAGARSGSRESGQNLQPAER